MYKIYLGDVMFPIAPSNIELKISNKNKTTVLIDEGEINFLRKPGLTNIKYDLLLPSTVKYPFAEYEGGFKSSGYYLDYIESLKVNKKPFMFRVKRPLPDGRFLFEQNMKVTLEEYSIKDDVNDGFDIVVSLNLKQYRDFGTKIGKVTFTPRQAQKTVKTGSYSTTEDVSPVINEVKDVRQTDNSPEPVNDMYMAFADNTTTMEIAKRFYGNSELYVEIEKVNHGLSIGHFVPANMIVKLPGKKRFDK